MNEQNPLEIFQQVAPEVASAFDGLIQSLIKMKGLDPKTKQLIYIGMKAATGDSLAVKYHVPMAKKFGATREEITDTILLTLSTSGLRGVSSCLPMALNAFDES
ncbi:MAG: carboxymuconolactone decarboxylase family protein [Bacillota bacterium]